MTSHEHSTATPDQAQQPLTPEQLQAQDPAGELIDIVRTVYNHVHTDAQREAIFNPDGFDGTVDLLGIVADVRDTPGATIDEGQQLFVDYMAQQAQAMDLESKVDFNELMSAPRMDIGDEAARRNLENIARSIATKSSKETNEAEKAHLLEQRQSIFEYRKLIGKGETVDSGTGSIGHDFMQQYSAILEANVDTPEAIPALLEEAAKQMNERAATLAVQSEAYKAILEHGHKYNAAAPTTEVDMDPRLDYVVAAANPVTPGQPRAGAANAPAGTPIPAAAGGATPPPAGPPPTGPTGNPPAGAPQPGNQAPQGPTDKQREQAAAAKAELQNARLGDLRAEVAKNKSQFIRNHKFGRKILSAFAGPGNSIKTQQDLDAVENEYNELVIAKAMEDNKALFANPLADDESKRFAMTQSITAERQELGDEVNHNMQNRVAHKVGKWMNNHKVVTVAGMAILAPLTGLATVVAGASLGAGMLAGAKMDAKYRGLRDAKESLSSSQLFNNTEKVSRKKVAEVFAIATKPNHGYTAAKLSEMMAEAVDHNSIMQNLAMKDLNRNISREMYLKRLGAIVTMGGIAFAGTHFLANPGGADSWIYNHQQFMRWGIVGAGAGVLYRDSKKKSAGGGHH